MNILFRCDAAPDIGFGHASRCLNLAKAFQDNHECEISFAIRRSDQAITQIKALHTVFCPDDLVAFDYQAWLTDCVETSRADILILDVRDGLESGEILTLKKYGVYVVTIDDPEEKRLASDLAFYPPVPQVEEMDWADYRGKYFSGWEYTIVNKIPDGNASDKNTPPIELLLSMGWSDPAKLTLFALKALNSIETSIQVSVVIGDGFNYKDELRTAISNSHHQITPIENSDNLLPLMNNSQLVLVSFGVTAYEAASLGIPSILICLTEDHVRSASAFHDAAIGFNMGLYKDIEVDKLTHMISSISNNKAELQKMSESAIKLKCGNTALITDEIVKYSGHLAD